MKSPAGPSTLFILISLLLHTASSIECGFWKGATTKENFNVDNYCSYYCPGAGYSDATCGKNTCYCACDDGSTPSFVTQECAVYDSRAVDPATFYMMIIYGIISLICVIPTVLVCIGCCLYWSQKREERDAERNAITNTDDDGIECCGKSVETSDLTHVEEDEQDIVEAVAIHSEAVPLHSNHSNADLKDKSGITRAYLVAPSSEN